MKKPALLLTSALLTLALAACGGEETPPAESAAPAESAGPVETAAPAESAGPASGGALYVPGTYTGVGEGYNGPVTVTVEVSDAAILSVTVVSHSDSESLIQKCSDNLLPLMVEANSADVAPISGATLTSDGYKGAVRDALAQAGAD